MASIHAFNFKRSLGILHDMALITCPECKQQVSELAVSCPTCGIPITEASTQISPPRIPPPPSQACEPPVEEHLHPPHQLENVRNPLRSLINILLVGVILGWIKSGGEHSGLGWTIVGMLTVGGILAMIDFARNRVRV